MIDQKFLYAVMLISITTVGLAILGNVLGNMNNSSSLQQFQSDTIIGTYGSAKSLTYNNFVPDTDAVTCGVALTRTTDYTPSASAGTITVLAYPRKASNENFTSAFDTNVTLANTVINKTTGIVFNCTDFSTFTVDTDYFLFSNGKIEVNSTGTMLNATEYCINYTYAKAASGTTCGVTYNYYDRSLSLGMAGFTTWMTWIQIVIIVFIATVIMALLYHKIKPEG